MDASFWHRRWAENNIAFHQSAANPLLVQYFKELSLVQDSRVFLPLCGKTLDIAWLLAHGYRVVGAELSKIAVEQLFIELGVAPKISRIGVVDRYNAPNIDVFTGDIFDLSSQMLGSVDAIYDRAALVALPTAMRDRYTTHLIEITNKAPQLLICYEYDQHLTDGPPFSIGNEEVNQHYQNIYDLALLASVNVPNGLRGQYPATEHVWLLKNN